MGGDGGENAVEQTLTGCAASTRDRACRRRIRRAPRTLADLYREHRMRMVRLAILLVDDPSTAEDVVQEAFAGLHRHWSGLRDEAAALGYLRTAVVNGSRSVLRRRRTARDYVPPHQVNARSAESLAMLSAEHQAVVDALATLPPRQREVLVLRYYGGLSEAEIAEATGITPRHREVHGEPGARRRRPRDESRGRDDGPPARSPERRLAEALRARATGAGRPGAVPGPRPGHRAGGQTTAGRRGHAAAAAALAARLARRRRCWASALALISLLLPGCCPARAESVPVAGTVVPRDHSRARPRVAAARHDHLLARPLGAGRPGG